MSFLFTQMSTKPLERQQGEVIAQTVGILIALQQRSKDQHRHQIFYRHLQHVLRSFRNQMDSRKKLLQVGLSDGRADALGPGDRHERILFLSENASSETLCPPSGFATGQLRSTECCNLIIARKS